MSDTTIGGWKLMWVIVVGLVWGAVPAAAQEAPSTTTSTTTAATTASTVVAEAGDPDPSTATTTSTSSTASSTTTSTTAPTTTTTTSALPVVVDGFRVRLGVNREGQAIPVVEWDDEVTDGLGQFLAVVFVPEGGGAWVWDGPWDSYMRDGRVLGARVAMDPSEAYRARLVVLDRPVRDLGAAVYLSEWSEPFRLVWGDLWSGWASSDEARQELLSRLPAVVGGGWRGRLMFGIVARLFRLNPSGFNICSMFLNEDCSGSFEDFHGTSDAASVLEYPPLDFAGAYIQASPRTTHNEWGIGLCVNEGAEQDPGPTSPPIRRPWMPSYWSATERRQASFIVGVSGTCEVWGAELLGGIRVDNPIGVVGPAPWWNPEYGPAGSDCDGLVWGGTTYSSEYVLAAANMASRMALNNGTANEDGPWSVDEGDPELVALANVLRAQSLVYGSQDTSSATITAAEYWDGDSWEPVGVGSMFSSAGQSRTVRVRVTSGGVPIRGAMVGPTGASGLVVSGDYGGRLSRDRSLSFASVSYTDAAGWATFTATRTTTAPRGSVSFGSDVWLSEIGLWEGVRGGQFSIMVEGFRNSSVSYAWDDVFATARLGDLVWRDRNRNGIQDPGEAGVDGVVVTLELSDGSAPVINPGGLPNPQTTRSSEGAAGAEWSGLPGRYLFSELNAAEYRVRFSPGSGYRWTTQNVGSDDRVDSDVDPVSGVSSVRSLALAENDGLLPPAAELDVDGGLFRLDGSLGLVCPTDEMVYGQPETMSVTLRNDADVLVAGEPVVFEVRLAEGMDVGAVSPPAGWSASVSGDPATGVTITVAGQGPLGAGAAVVVDVEVVLTTSFGGGDTTVAAEIMGFPWDWDSTPGNGVPAEDDYARCVAAVADYDLSVTKIYRGSSTYGVLPFAATGDLVEFSAEVSNEGPNSVPSWTVTETLPAGDVYVGLVDDAAGAVSATDNGVGTVTFVWTEPDSRFEAGDRVVWSWQTVAGGWGTRCDWLEIVSDGGEPPSDTDSTPGNGVPGEDDIWEVCYSTPSVDLAVEKSILNADGLPVDGVPEDAPKILLGDRVEWVLSVTHEAGDPLPEMVVREMLPSGVRFEAAAPPAGWEAAVVVVSDDVTSGVMLDVTVRPQGRMMVAGDRVDLSVVGRVPDTPPEVVVACNRGGVGWVPAGVTDPDSTPGNTLLAEDDWDEACFEAVWPGLELSKVANYQQVMPGDTITYVGTATNTGTIPLVGVVVEDVLADPLLAETVVATPTVGDVSVEGRRLEWTIPMLLPGETGVMTYRVDVSTNYIGVVENTMTVEGAVPARWSLYVGGALPFTGFESTRLVVSGMVMLGLGGLLLWLGRRREDEM